MASRRLDISSLLCDDPQPPFSPLDVLVHAATEERRRLEQSPPPPRSPRAPSPPPRPSYDHPPAFPRHPADFLHRSPQLPSYDRRLGPDPDLAQQHQRAQALEFHRQQERDRALIAHELVHRRREDDERRLFEQYGRQQREQQEYELRKREDRLREDRLREIERRQLEEQEQQQRLLQRELERREHERREMERREIERELERRELERREHERRELERRERERQLAERQQREAAERQHELDRRREKERIDELRRRQQIQLDHQPRYLEPHPIVTSPHPPSISHLISHSVSPRPSDRPQISPLPIKMPPDSPTIAIPTSSQEDPRPIKKRRYSESPTRPIPDDKEHIARERDKMVVGELGYGRVESITVAPAQPPRRPGSGHGHTRKVAVADLLTVDKERPISSTPEIRDRDAHRVLSPLGRRSPPGSQIGRAKAARKSDEHLLREPPPQSAESGLKKFKEEPKIKQELKPSRSQDTIRSPVIDDARPTKPISKEVAPPLATTTAPAPPKIQPAARKRNQEDVYEWFLKQYEDKEPSPTISAPLEPPHTPSPSLSPVTSTFAAPSTAKSPPAPHRSPFTAAVSLEEELEELVSKPPMSNSALPAQDPDIDMELDVDLAVNELVETLEADDSDVKREPKTMEVDVEDELLSLLDDTPKPAPPSSSSSSAARRNPPSSAAPTSSSSHAAAPVHAHSHSHSHAVHVKPPSHNRSASEAPHVSPVVSNAAGAALSPVLAVRHPSTRPTSERGSMPPPASTGGASKKGTERAGSVTPTSTGASATAPTATGSNPTAKKKKEATAKAKAKNANGATVPSATSTAPTTAKPKPKVAAKGKKGAAADAVSVGGTASTPSGPSGGKGAKGPAGVSITGRKTAPSASRSRSASVMPAGSVSVGPESDAVRAEKQEEEEDSEAEANEDDKLYCVCKTKYDEDRFMIACDRCDEWYHTQCVKMPDLEVDLVDQFICPLCIEKNPHLNLRTTYKARCLYGLRYPDPSSTKACHKAARGAFSKYCSDECGVKYMQSRIDTWAKKGGKAEKLWDSVKGAEKREGVVCAVEVESDEDDVDDATDIVSANPEAKKPNVNGCAKMETDGTKGEEDEEEVGDEKEAKSPKEQKEQHPQSPKHKLKHQHTKTRVVPPTKSKVARETERLKGLLDAVIRLREEIKRGMEIVVWREQLLKLASERAEAVGQCGWDQRLCMDDEEWADIGAGVIESYEDAVLRAEAAKEDGVEGDMEVDGAEEQWWCPGKKVCDRHQGWQTVRHKDVCKEKEKKEEALAKLTTREREIRKRIEDMLDPQSTNNPATANHTTIQISNAKDTLHVPLKSSNTKSVNGHAKSKAAAASGDAHKKGKKRKAPAS